MLSITIKQNKMRKFSSIVAWAYLAVGIIFTVEIFLNWNTDRQKSLVSAFMALLAIFMFFFKRRMKNKKTEQ